MFEHAIIKQWVVDSLINAPAAGDNTTLNLPILSAVIPPTWHMAQRGLPKRSFWAAFAAWRVVYYPLLQCACVAASVLEVSSRATRYVTL